jgi:hypothetical protein
MKHAELGNCYFRVLRASRREGLPHFVHCPVRFELDGKSGASPRRSAKRLLVSRLVRILHCG